MDMKTFVFAFDCADYELIKEYEEHLPTISKLMNEGMHGELETVYPPSTTPGWSAFMTGKNSGKSNVMYWGNSLNPGTYEVNDKGSEMIYSPEIWDYATEEGLKSVVHNMPVTYPPRKITGCMVSGFDTPNEECIWTQPENLQTELEEALDYSPIEPGKINDLGPDRYIGEYYKHQSTMLRGAGYLLNKHDDWDLFVTCFTLLDRFIHQFINTRMNELEYMARGDVVKRAYKLADRYLDKLLKQAGYPEEDMNIVILSDHGSRPVRKLFNLNTLLLNSGLAKLSDKGRHIMRHGGISDVSEMHEFFDWENTKAWVCPDMLGGGAIYLNDDRFPEPTVTDRERAIKEVKSVVEEAYCKGTNSPVEEVVRKENLFEGEFVKDFPDLICMSGDGWKWDHKVLRPHRFKDSGGLRGEHRMKGFYSVTTPDTENEEKHTHILNMFPTVLNLLGADVPIDIDGETLIDKGVDSREPIDGVMREKGEYSKELQSKLEDLGYV